MNSAEMAETEGLQTLLAELGSGLDKYLKFEHDDAMQSESLWKKVLDIPLPEQGVGIQQVTQELINDIIPNGAPITRPGFCAYITTGSTSVSALASTAAHVASPQRYMHTAFNYLEELSLQWLGEMCGVGFMQGVYSTGGSVANLIALGGARQSAFEKRGVDPARDGINSPVRVYASTECHHTIQRSCAILGLGRRCVKPIECDENGRMKVDILRQAIESDKTQNIVPMAIVANAGTTNTGAIDPLLEIGEIAELQSIWFHVDGAYGLPGILDERISHLYKGLELADSVIVDPHKWLGASVGIGATFVRDRKILQRAFTQESADYLEGSVEQSDDESPIIEHSMDGFGIPYFDYSVELSAPSRGVVVWALIREIGVEGMRQRIKRHNDMARYIAEFARQHDELELLLEPTLSICCFRYVSEKVTDLDSLNQRLYRKLVRENEFLPSTTRVNGKLALRPCWINPRSDQSHVDGLLASVLRIGQELVDSLSKGQTR